MKKKINRSKVGSAHHKLDKPVKKIRVTYQKRSYLYQNYQQIKLKKSDKYSFINRS